MKRIAEFTLAVMALMSGTLFAETFSWRHAEAYTAATPPANPNWKSFGDASNWAVGTSKTADNPGNLIPGENDDINYGGDAFALQCYDLGNSAYTVKSYGGTTWNRHLLMLKNGALAFLNSFTNYNARFYICEGGKLTLGRDSEGLCGKGGSESVWVVRSGGELDISGSVYMHLFRMTVEDGGTATFCPKAFNVDSSANKVNGISFVRNYGVLNLPEGVKIGGYGGGRPNVVLLEQSGGTMNVGGNFKMAQWGDRAEFVLSGGTINVTADVMFDNFGSVMMTNDAVATVNVAAGKTLDLTKMVFCSGTVLTKTGEGTVEFGDSVPETLDIVEGSMALTTSVEFGDLAVNVAAGMELDLSVVTFKPEAVLTKNGDGTLKLGSSVPSQVQISRGIVTATKSARFESFAFTSGGVLHLAADGIYVKEIIGEENAVITADSTVIATNKPFFVVEDENDASVVAEKITAPEGFHCVANSGTLTFEKAHGENAGFVWKKQGNADYWSFWEKNYWGVGDTADAVNANDWIPGENDVINYGFQNGWTVYLNFNMGGYARKVKGLGKLMHNDSKYAKLNLGVKNGTLQFTSCFTNTKANVCVSEHGAFILGDTCSSRMGFDGNINSFEVENGGECIIGGKISMHILNVTVNSGGRMVFSPVVFGYDSTVHNTNPQSYLRNSGTLEIPNGFTLGGASKGGCSFTVEQFGGELLLGGDIVMTDTVDYLDFKLSNGTVRVLNDVAFVGCRTVAMLGGAAAEIAVAEEKTANFSTMTFEADTSVVKTGSGSLKLGASVPASLAVEAGRLVVGAAANYGSALTLGEGATLHFAAAGASFASLAGLDAASVTFDESALKPGAVLFTTSDAELAAAMAAKILPLVESFSGDRRTLVAAEDGNGRTAFKVVSKRGLKVIVK